MGLFSWIFGKQASARSAWAESEAGNPTRVVGGTQITVYPKDGGWRFSCGKVGADIEDVHFSETFYTEEEAKEEAMRFVTGAPSLHKSRSQVVAERNEETTKALVSKIQSEWDERKRKVPDVASMKKADMERHLRPLKADHRTLFIHQMVPEMPPVSEVVLREMETMIATLQTEIAARPDRKRKD